jgi:hypothetical protein
MQVRARAALARNPRGMNALEMNTASLPLQTASHA